MLLDGFARGSEKELLAAVDEVIKASPLRHMVTPGGHRMLVAMTNCGVLGWVTDRTGYRYDRVDPETGRSWPAMPTAFSELASSAAAKAGFPTFSPDACLINCYIPGARLTLHQDCNEADFGAPIVSVSLALPAVFLWGGLTAPSCSTGSMTRCAAPGEPGVTYAAAAMARAATVTSTCQ